MVGEGEGMRSLLLLLCLVSLAGPRAACPAALRFELLEARFADLQGRAC